MSTSMEVEAGLCTRKIIIENRVCRHRTQSNSKNKELMDSVAYPLGSASSLGAIPLSMADWLLDPKSVFKSATPYPVARSPA